MRLGPRNGRVASGSLIAGQNAVAYTVPTDFNFIWRSLVFNAPSGPAGNRFNVWLVPINGPAVIIITEQVDGGTGIVWEGWTALNAGDIIYMGTTTAPGAYWIAGAVLPMLPGVSPVGAEAGPLETPELVPLQVVRYIPAPGLTPTPS